MIDSRSFENLDDSLEKWAEQCWRDEQISVLEQALKFAIYSKNKETFDMIKEVLGTPRELTNIKLEQIKSYQVLEKEGKISVQFELHENLV